MEKLNVSNSGEIRRPLSNAYCEDVGGADDTDTLSELSENELLFGFLNPNLLPATNTSAIGATGQVSSGQVAPHFASVGD